MHAIELNYFYKIFLLSNPLNQNPKPITVNPFFTATLSSLISQSFEMFNEYFRKHYLYLLKIVNKICCLRPTPRIRLNYLKCFKQKGLLLNMETSSQELVILSYAHP